MKVKLPGRKSDNVIDRRGQTARGGMQLPIGMLAGGGIPGLILVAVLVLFGGSLFGDGGGGFSVETPFDSQPVPPSDSGLGAAPDPEAELVQFVSFVLDDIQVLWADQFAASGLTYDETQLILFRDGVESGCGFASSATGPFYCPAPGDQQVYLDLGFFEELARRFDAPGDFAQAYVIAHEVGHHVQNITGISDEVRRLQQQNPDEANELSIRLELQADCFAGVWGYSTNERGILEAGDIDEGLAAAAAVGDDRIQEQAGGGVNPESWTHGSSEQRVEWFRRGFDSGDPARCDTFEGDV